MTEVSISISRDPVELVRARDWLRAELARCRSEDLTGAVTLMASELLTNAIVHTDSAPSLTLSVAAREIRVAVTDGDPRPPVLVEHDATTAGGNGLRIIDAWAKAWGTTADPPGKSVWFSVVR